MLTRHSTRADDAERAFAGTRWTYGRRAPPLGRGTRACEDGQVIVVLRGARHYGRARRRDLHRGIAEKRKPSSAPSRPMLAAGASGPHPLATSSAACIGRSIVAS